MYCHDAILKTIEKVEPNSIINSSTRFLGECDSYENMIKNAIVKSGTSPTSLASNMRIDSRTFYYISSKTDSRHRHITFYEALRFIIVQNMSFDEANEFLSLCNYTLCPFLVRDMIISEILKNKHSNYEGMDNRLDCLIALEDNEPFNDNEYDYKSLFDYIKRKAEKN